MSWPLVIFDLDDTLCDYRSARPHGFAALGRHLERAGVGRESFAAEFERAGAHLKADLQLGRLSRRDYNAARFNLCVNRCFPASLSHPDIARDLQRRYEDAILDHVDWAVGARAGFEAVAALHPVAILTNGAARLQHEKVRRLGIVADGVFVSDEVGLSKPHPQAFRNVADAFDAMPGEVVMVGDSIRHDAVPAAILGMRAILVGRTPDHATWSGESAASVMDVARRLAGTRALREARTEDLPHSQVPGGTDRS